MSKLEQKLTPGLKNYEDKLRRPYSELGDGALTIQKWGTAIMKRDDRDNRINVYTDDSLIREQFSDPIREWFKKNRDTKDPKLIADLGGSDGFLLQKVIKNIRDENPDIDLKSFAIDIDSTGKAEEAFLDKKNRGERQNIEFAKGDITKLPFGDSSFDAVISRMTFQYLDNEEQKIFLSEVSRVLKESGLFIMVTASECPDSDNVNFNKVLNTITYIISGEQKFQRRVPSFNEFLEKSDFADKYSLELIFSSREIDFPFSVSAFGDRFRLSDEQIENLNKLYQFASKKYPELFETIDGELCLKSNMINMRFKKSKSKS